MILPQPRPKNGSKKAGGEISNAWYRLAGVKAK
jgi:hypothetical protein